MGEKINGDNINICVIGVTGGKGKGTEKNNWRNNDQNFSKFDEKYKSTEPKTSMIPPSREKKKKQGISLNPKQVKKTTPGHIIIKLLKTYKSRMKRQIMYREQKIRVTADFLLGTIHARRSWCNSFIVRMKADHLKFHTQWHFLSNL